MFCRFPGVQSAPGSGAVCPFLGHSCFQNKCFAVFRGCNRRQWGIGMSLFRTFLFLKKSFCQNRDIKWPKMAQNGPKLHNYLRACPFLGHSYFEFKCFAQIRTCNIMCVFHNMQSGANAWHVICSQKNEKFSSPNLAKCYHFVIILLSSRRFCEIGANNRTPYDTIKPAIKTLS